MLVKADDKGQPEAKIDAEAEEQSRRQKEEERSLLARIEACLWTRFLAYRERREVEVAYHERKRQAEEWQRANEARLEALQLQQAAQMLDDERYQPRYRSR